MSTIFAILIIASIIWVAYDASKIGVKKGMISGMFNMGIFGWVVACILVWIIFFPAYIIKRGEYIKAGTLSQNFAGFCSKCGKPLNVGVTFCSTCGNPIGAQSVQEVKKNIFD